MYQKQSFDFITKQVAKKMNKKLLCVVLLTVLVIAAGTQPPLENGNRVGKRHFKVHGKFALFTVHVCFVLIFCLRT